MQQYNEFINFGLLSLTQAIIVTQWWYALKALPPRIEDLLYHDDDHDMSLKVRLRPDRDWTIKASYDAYNIYKMVL